MQCVEGGYTVALAIPACRIHLVHLVPDFPFTPALVPALGPLRRP